MLTRDLFAVDNLLVVRMGIITLRRVTPSGSQWGWSTSPLQWIYTRVTLVIAAMHQSTLSDHALPVPHSPGKHYQLT